MKNRRNIIVAFLLCACLIVGVGFAELTDTLTATGATTITKTGADDAFKEDIYFSNAVANVASNEDGVTANVANVDGSDNNQATFTVNSFKRGGDTATFTFTIQNDSTDLTANLSVDIANNGTDKDYFTVESDWTTNTVAAGQPIEITVTVTLNDTPNFDGAADSITGDFVITINVESAVVNA